MPPELGGVLPQTFTMELLNKMPRNDAGAIIIDINDPEVRECLKTEENRIYLKLDL